MKRKGKKRALLGIMAGLCLLFCGCAGTVEEIQVPNHAPSASSRPAARDDLALSAGFQGTDGQILSLGSALLQVGETDTQYPLDQWGRADFSGLPREGELWLSLLDREDREVGRAPLLISTGEVIDASSDGEGVGYVTVREDTPRVELVFILTGEGRLICALQLEDG